jgi:hypothetical protein
MYKPKNPASNSNRLRLDIETRLPNLYTMEQQLMESKSRRGCLVELPWTTGKPNQLFILSVTWDPTSPLPIWTLYEQNNMESKMHWSEQYPPGDLQIMYDVVTMSVTGSEPPAQIPESLRPKEFPPGMGGKTPAPVLPQPVAAIPPPAAAMGYPAPAPGYAPSSQPQQAYAPPPGQVPPGQYPGDPNAAAYAANPYPQPYYAPPSAYPPPGAPPAGWQQYPQAAPMPQQAPPAAPAPPPQANVAPPPQAPPPVPDQAASAPSNSSRSQIDYSLISKRSKLQLGKLLVDSRIISQSTLDAALKIQELVEDGQVLPDAAPTALGKWHTKGSSIGQFVDNPEFEGDQPEEKRRAKIGQIPEVSKLPISMPKSAAEARGAFDLLKKSGILTEEDIKAASEVRRKHGGDIIQILQSAGKLDKFTFESSVACIPLIDLGLMKMEQVAIVIQYCSRMRVDFDIALDELGWQNPRKIRKDLNL